MSCIMLSMKIYSGPEFAVLIDLSGSDVPFGNFWQENGTTPSRVRFESDLRRLAVWGAGTVAGDVLDYGGTSVARLKIYDFKGDDRKGKMAGGRVVLDTENNTGLNLVVSKRWVNFDRLPGVRAMWIRDEDFDLRKLPAYFEII